MSAPDVVIVGGGVIGTAIAYELARRGAGRVEVIERDEPGSGASGAAAGVLAVASARAPGGALFELRRAGARLFPEFAEELREQSGLDIEYRENGLLKLAFSEQEAHELRGLVRRREEQGFATQWLEAPHVSGVQPGIAADIHGAAYFPGEGAVNPARLVQALHAAAERLGVIFRCASPVSAIEVSGSKALALCAGTERLAVGTMVLAAGAWSAEMGGLLGIKVPVRPDKGEMVALRGPRTVRCTVSWGDGYLAPRQDGRILVGSTSARGLFDRVVTAGSVHLLLARALRMLPELQTASIVHMWAGPRPCPTIRRPIIGFVRGYENVVMATGHHRSGILLAPITARLVAELLLERATSIDLQPFCYRPK